MFKPLGHLKASTKPSLVGYAGRTSFHVLMKEMSLQFHVLLKEIGLKNLLLF
ncbi:MAG: hypothetical protein QXO32_03030 [Candidatus Bathyarchaeia archaeon]